MSFDARSTGRKRLENGCGLFLLVIVRARSIISSSSVEISLPSGSNRAAMIISPLNAIHGYRPYPTHAVSTAVSWNLGGQNVAPSPTDWSRERKRWLQVRGDWPPFVVLGTSRRQSEGWGRQGIYVVSVHPTTVPQNAEIQAPS